MQKITPKDFFLHIGVMVTLYVSSISLIALLFQIINISFPDALNSYVDPYSTGIRWAIACLVIIFPLYIFLSWLLERSYKAIPEKRSLGIRHWLIYLTLFAAGIAIVTDLIVLINSFLGGEITTRFGLKILVVLAVAGFVFGFYLWDLRRSATPSNKPKIFAITACLLVLASIVGGFAIMGSPMSQRLIRFDNQKISDLQSIQWQVVNFWQQKQTIPANLADLSDPISSFMMPHDPQTNESYEYRKISTLSFELCANFNKAGDFDMNRGDYYMDYSMAPLGSPDSSSWTHEAGRTCFERTIDPERYPPYKN